MGCHQPLSQRNTPKRGGLEDLTFLLDSPGPLGHLSVCRLRISLSTLLLGVCLGKFLRLPWVLRRQAWIPGSPLPRACQVEVEAAGQSEL